jgi:hypothetical protein
MNLDQLRRWVRDELAPTERREVGRWILRCGDPALPVVLQGLIREHEQEQADAALRARRPDRAFVTDLWRSMLDAGQGWIQALAPDVLPSGAVLGGDASAPPLSIHAAGTDVTVVVHVPVTCVATVFATSDRGDEFILLDSTRLSAGTHPLWRAWTPEADEGRVTFWLLRQPAGARPCVSLAAAAALTTHGSGVLVAARWVDPD